MHSRKSQIFGQVFIYILAIIIFSLVLLYGYKTIKDFSKKAEDVSLIQLTTDIKTSVKKISSDYGSVIKKELSIPGKYRYVCFVDLQYHAQTAGTGICIDGNPDYHPTICNSWEDATQQNMFLITVKEEIQPYYIQGIEIEDKYKCLYVKERKIVLRLEGKGDYVELSEWEQ